MLFDGLLNHVPKYFFIYKTNFINKLLKTIHSYNKGNSHIVSTISNCMIKLYKEKLYKKINNILNCNLYSIIILNQLLSNEVMNLMSTAGLLQVY